MNLFKATRIAIQHQGMPEAYCNYLLRRSLGLRGPYIRVGDDIRIGRKWVNFSEYWSYRGAGHGPGPSLPPAITSLISACQHHARGRSVAIDVGANIGIFTAAFAAAGFSEIHAFEPVPATFARLSENIEFNHFGAGVQLNLLALGDKERVANILYDRKSPATAHLIAATVSGECSVQVTTLDRYTESKGIRHIDFLKIDTEGYETAVLRGATRLFQEKRISIVLLEWCPELLMRAGSSPEELWQFIRDMGYVLHQISGNLGTDTLVTLDELRSTSWANLIATPASGVI